MPQQLRIYIFMDQGSESARYVAAAEHDGSEIRRIAKYGGPEVVEGLFKAMVSWLGSRRVRFPGPLLDAALFAQLASQRN